MRKLLLITISAMALTGVANASDQLAFHVQENEDATIYNLQLQHENTVKTIWSRRVELINGNKPYDWGKLIEWEQNENGILALVENNEVSGKLLQFGSNGDLVAELDSGGSWLQGIRRGGSIKLMPLGRIEFTSPDGSNTKFMIHDGQLADEHGKVFERTEPLQIEKLTSVVPEHDPDINATALSSGGESSAPTNMPEALSKSTDQNDEKTSSSSQWVLAAVGIVAALGLLWLILKMRK